MAFVILGVQAAILGLCCGNVQASDCTGCLADTAGFALGQASQYNARGCDAAASGDFDSGWGGVQGFAIEDD